MHIDEALPLQKCEKAAHCLDRQTEVTRDVLAPHAQPETGSGKAQFSMPHGKPQQECGEASFRRHAGEPQHESAVTRDILAQKAQQLLQQLRQTRRELRKSPVWNDAYLGVLQRDRIVGVNVAADRIESQYLGRQMQPDDFRLARTSAGDTFERAAANGEEKVEWIALAVERRTLRDLALFVYDIVELGYRFPRSTAKADTSFAGNTASMRTRRWRPRTVG